MKLLVFTLFLFGISVHSYAQNSDADVSPEIRRIVKKIALVNKLLGPALGEGADRPEQYNNFIFLKDNATVKELIKLTAHKNAVVRSYSFWALAHHKDVNLHPFIAAHLADTARFLKQFGCIMSEGRVCDFFVEVVTPYHLDDHAQKFSLVEIARLDSSLATGRTAPKIR